jgi:hypothetical protein
VRSHDDPDDYQRYIRPENRGEDDPIDEIPFVEPNDEEARRMRVQTRIAAASHFFEKKILKPKITQHFLCSATLSATFMNPIGLFDNTKTTPFFMVYPKPGYTGIERFKIPEGCALEHMGNMKLHRFEESEASQRMLQKFYDRSNACDGTVLQAKPGSNARPIELRGMLFVSCHTEVEVINNGVDDFAGSIQETVRQWGERHDPNKTLFVCFVGRPRIIFAGERKEMPKGASFETMYNEAARLARNNEFENVRLGPNEPFSTVCTHCVLIGFSMTRRAMTAAFSPKDEPDVLCKIQYGVMTAPKKVTIDIASQRLNRPSHEFAEHVVPDDYCVDVAMSPLLLEACQKFRKFEDEMAKEQRECPVIHSMFRKRIDVYKNDLQNYLFGKRHFRMDQFSATGKKRHARERLKLDSHPVLKDFMKWLTELEEERLPNGRYRTGTVEQYYGIVRQWFTQDADVHSVYERAQHKLAQLLEAENPSGVHHNHIKANQRFCEFYKGSYPPAGADADES